DRSLVLKATKALLQHVRKVHAESAKKQLFGLPIRPFLFTYDKSMRTMFRFRSLSTKFPPRRTSFRDECILCAALFLHGFPNTLSYALAVIVALCLLSSITAHSSP